MSSQYAPNQRIELNDGRQATIRFVGPTAFQVGEWIGVELDEATGKNDGSVKGERYFDCKDGYGMFLKPLGVKRVLEEAPRTRKAGANAAVNGLKKEEGVGRRGSTIGVGGGSPTPSAGRLGAGLRSPTKGMGSSNGASSGSTSRTNTPPFGRRAVGAAVPPKSSRPSIAPASTAAGRRFSTQPAPAAAASARTSRPSLAPPSTGARAAVNRSPPGRSNPTRPPLQTRSSVGPRLSSTSESVDDDDGSEQPGLASSRGTASTAPSQPEEEIEPQEAEEDQTVRPNFAPPPVPPDPVPATTRARRPSSPTAASIHSTRTARSTAASNRHVEELEAKLKLMERKRLEDRDVKTRLEGAQKELTQYKTLADKLQNKVRPQQQEIVKLKLALTEAEARSNDTEALQAEHDNIMEMATVDREMAEIKTEEMQVQLDELRLRSEEMELELEVLREENAELGKEMSPDERTSAGWLQMERSNERLREALLRLRDITQDQEAELKEQIGGLQDQVKELDALKEQHETTRDTLLRSEADMEDLRQQLEAAAESDEMIEELTDRNGQLEDQVRALHTTIEELEEMREINDELQANYTEQEKQFLDELDFRDSLLIDRERTAKLQQEQLDEADHTLHKFRELVSRMQGDLQDLEASKSITETEAKDLEGKSRAMLDLNLRLQSSVAKTQVKTLDLELRKLEAREASEHLSIVQLFLPEAFQAERNSVLALLRFKRIAFKAQLVHNFMKERVASFGARGEEEDVFAACDVLDKLVWIAAMSDRFVNSISGCGIDVFASYGDALYELEPVERALNGYVEGLRKDELNESAMAEELQRSIAVMEHLGGLHIADDAASRADETVMRTLHLQSMMESTASAMGIVKSMIEKNVQTVDEGDEDDDDEATSSDVALILSRADTLITHARSAKVTAGKTQRALSDLLARSLALEQPCLEPFDGLDSVTSSVARYARSAGEALQSLFGEEGRSDGFSREEVSGALSRAAIKVFALSTPEAGPFSALQTRLKDVSEQLGDLAALPNDLDNTIEFDRLPAPWVARAEQIKQTKLTTIDTEAELARALQGIKDRDVELKAKETELEEQSVRIEMLEARMKEASKRSARIGELERVVHEARDAEKAAKKEIERLRDEKDREIARVRDEVGRLAMEHGKGGEGFGELDDGAMGANVRLTVRKQEHKILSLEGAVRYLKSENHRLLLPAPDAPLAARAALYWLHEPLLPTKSEEHKRVATSRHEAKSVMKELLQMCERRQTVDLTLMPENKLAWRAAKETSRWKVERAREEWEGWRQWRSEVVKAGTEAIGEV